MAVKKAEQQLKEDTELVHFRWERFKSMLAAHFQIVDQQLAKDPNDLEKSIGAVMDGLEAVLGYRGRLHHALSRKAKRHGIDPSRFGWGFSARAELSDEAKEVDELLTDKK